MKITIKSLKKVEYEVEIASDELLIKDLKAEIEKTHGFEADSIKVLFKGSMLDDKKQIKDYIISEGDTLTMMSSKVKPQNINSNPVSQIPEESKDNSNKTKTNNSNTNNPNNNNSKELKKNENATKPNSTTNTESLVSGLIKSLNTNNANKEPEKDYSAEALQLTEMGFGFAEALQAVKAAKGSLERAVDYMYNGIPANSTGVPLLEDFLDPAGEDEEGEEGEDGDEEHEFHHNGEIPLTFEIDPHMLDSLDLNDPNSLKTIASFVKVLINEDPSSLQNLLEDIEETNPEIIEFIKEHEDEFKQLISAPLEDKDLEKFLPMASNNQSLNANVEENNANNNNNDKEGEKEQSEQIKGNEQLMLGAENDEDSEMLGHPEALDFETVKSAFSEAEMQSIERLKTLGFSEEEVCQGFVACEKNEMLTANFLLENKFKFHNSMDVDGNFINN